MWAARKQLADERDGEEGMNHRWTQINADKEEAAGICSFILFSAA
jgi:hypothetical protein